MNKDRKELGAELAYAALDDVPTPKADAKEIIGLVKSGGRITGYRLNNYRREQKNFAYKKGRRSAPLIVIPSMKQIPYLSRYTLCTLLKLFLECIPEFPVL